MTIQLKRNDTRDVIGYTMTYANGTPVNLTGASVRFIMGKGKTLITNASAKVISATKGEVEYALTEADTLVPGVMVAEFEVTFSDGKVKTFPSNGYIKLNIQANINAGQSTYIEDQIAFRVSDIQILKNSVQAQLNQFAKGATNAETSQARVEKDGTVNTTLKDRLDKKEAKFTTDIDSLSSQMALNMSKVSDYNLFPQSPRPSKQGIMTNNPKIVIKTGTDAFIIIQKTNKGYLKYVFDTANGKSKDQSNAGDNWELVRLKQARHLSDVYVWYDIATPTSGNLGVQTAPQVYADPESQLLDIGFRNDSRTFSSRNSVEGVGVHSLAGASQITYSIPITTAKRMNLLFQATSSGSNDVEILINGAIVKTFNPRAFLQGSSTGYGVVEFEIPTRRNSSSNMTITINNRATSLVFYPCAFNFVNLKDWNKHYVTQYKAIGSIRNDFIDEVGASDYAFMNKDRVLFGSYHGGEIRTYGKAMWTTLKQEDVDSYGSLKDFVDIPNGEWKILKDFKMVQKTSLLGGQGKMTSEFDFNIDGTIEMKFALTESTIEFISMFTALTCCGPTFNYVGYPWLAALPATDGEYYTVPMNEGYIVQYDPQLTGQEIVIRFTKFNESKNFRSNPYIWNSSNYKKFYYGPLIQADTVGGVRLVNNLSFSKGIDFNIK